MTKRGKIALVAGILYCLSGGLVRAMTSTNFTINWDSINSGGTDNSSSTNFGLRDTLGEQATSFSSSTNFQISAGYRTGDADNTTLSFSIGTQENSTETAYSAFASSTANTVTVSSASGYSVGNLIGVIENKGLSQIVAIGRITSIAGTVLTVDRWDGSPSSLSASPSGGDDFVYRLGGYAIDFGTMSSSVPKTSLTGTRISTSATNGYTVYVNSDGNLRYGSSSFIANVSDGTVSSGSEEYGWRVFGSSATNTGSDVSFATTTTAIQQSAGATNDERVGLVYKISITNATPAGNFSQSIFYTVTANF